MYILSPFISLGVLYCMKIEKLSLILLCSIPNEIEEIKHTKECTDPCLLKSDIYILTYNIKMAKLVYNKYNNKKTSKFNSIQIMT